MCTRLLLTFGYYRGIVTRITGGSKNFSPFSLFSTHIVFTMTDARLQAELAESKNEIQKLRERLSMGKPTLHKDLSLTLILLMWNVG